MAFLECCDPRQQLVVSETVLVTKVGHLVSASLFKSSVLLVRVDKLAPLCLTNVVGCIYLQLLFFLTDLASSKLHNFLIRIILFEKAKSKLYGLNAASLAEGRHVIKL